MLKCRQCGQENIEGTIFCESCGIALRDLGNDGDTVPTRRLGNDPDDLAAKGTWGAAKRSPGASVIVHVREAAEPIEIMPGPRLIIGRSDPSSDAIPDVDLAPYGGLEKGVSRQHAILEFSDDTLIIMDAGSANGTFLNGQRLASNRPRVLRDGDEVRLGKLVAHIYFK